MIKTEFIELYEKLSQLNEKWYNIEGYNRRLWFSESAIEFKNFMSNISSTGLRGLRLVIAPDFYLVGMAEDFNHEFMIEIAEQELFLDVPPMSELEQLTCGIPKCIDFELGDFELDDLKNSAKENPDREYLKKYLDYDVEKEYQGTLIADYGTFELNLYSFNSRSCPEHKAEYRHATYFEDSETYRVLKSMLKRIYIYGK